AVTEDALQVHGTEFGSRIARDMEVVAFARGGAPRDVKGGMAVAERDTDAACLADLAINAAEEAGRIALDARRRHRPVRLAPAADEFSPYRIAMRRLVARRRHIAFRRREAARRAEAREETGEDRPPDDPGGAGKDAGRACMRLARERVE